MQTCAWVVTLTADEPRAEAVRQTLRGAGPFTLGPMQGNKLAVVVETTDPHEAQAWHEWAAALPGVENIEVVFVHWEDAAPEVTHVHV